jgi:hypothetical protein
MFPALPLMGTIKPLARVTGDVERLIYGVDSLGNVCGKVNTGAGYRYPGSLEGLDLRARPNLYFLQPAQVRYEPVHCPSLIPP